MLLIKNGRAVCMVLLLTVCSCSKEKNLGGSVLVTVNCHGKALGQAEVYLRAGSPPETGAASIYDQRQAADAMGQVYFDALEPQHYFLFASGYDTQTHKNVSGHADISISGKPQIQHYKVVIQAE